MEKSLKTHLARGMVVSSIMLAANRAMNDIPGDAKFARERQMLLTLVGMCEHYFSVDRQSAEAEQLQIIAKQFSACCEAEIL